MFTIRRLAGRAFLGASVTMMMLMVAAPAWARPAPPERLVGNAAKGGGGSAPAQVISHGTPIWQFVLVAVVAGAAAIALAALANRTVLHSRSVLRDRTLAH